MKVVQIGTNDGDDDIREFCLNVRPDFVLLVEPFNYHLNKIKENYSDIIKNVYIENIAIHPTDNLRSVKLFYSERDGIDHKYQITSMIPEHLIKHGADSSELKTFEVPSLTINALFDKYSLKHIDYLFLDIEGIDFEVLKSINFEKYDIKHLQIEHIHLNLEELKFFMRKKGYVTTSRAIDTTGYDILFRKSTIFNF